MSDAPIFHVDVEEFWRDPYPALAQMQVESPICTVPELGATLVTLRDDVQACEKNVAVFSSHQPSGLMNMLMGHNMMRKDGADHRQERFVYYPAISPRQVQATWADRFRAIAQSVLDDMDGSGAADLVRTYATAVSGEALKVMTGLTNITYQQIDGWSQAMIDGVANYLGDPEAEARCHQATEAIDAAIDERLGQVLAEPDPSLLSVMTHAGLPEDAVRANIKLTISGGQNEPRDAIAGGIWALLTHPDQLELVRSGAVRWTQVFEEYCRWISPIGMSPRRISRAHHYGGTSFVVDERVFLMFGAANRDEAHFANSDGFDVTRDTSASLHFGAGPHFCAGAAASRSLVGEIALPLIFDQIRDLRLDGDVEFGGWAFRGPLGLPVCWGS